MLDSFDLNCIQLLTLFPSLLNFIKRFTFAKKDVDSPVFQLLKVLKGISFHWLWYRTMGNLDDFVEAIVDFCDKDMEGEDCADEKAAVLRLLTVLKAVKGSATKIFKAIKAAKDDDIELTRDILDYLITFVVMIKADPTTKAHFRKESARQTLTR